MSSHILKYVKCVKSELARSKILSKFMLSIMYLTISLLHLVTVLPLISPLGAYSFKRVEGWGLIRGFFQNFNFVGCLQMECKALPLKAPQKRYFIVD